METTEAIDLDAYCVRIGYEGPCVPRLAVLRDLCLLQTRAIPFENLDPLLGKIPDLDLASLHAKLVRSRRSGYCYEQNLLLLHVLRAIGFEARGLAARVLLNAEPGTLTARTHMLLEVRAEDANHIVDVGFGRTTPTGPLLLQAGIEQATPHESYRIDAAGAEFDVSVKIGIEWVLMYRFNRVELIEAEYRVFNHYVATAPHSFFRRSLIAALAVEGGRHVLFDDRLTFQHSDGRREERRLGDAEALMATLSDVFGITVPDPVLFSVTCEKIAAMRPE